MLLSPEAKNKNWGKQKSNQKSWEERLRNKMLWGIGILKSSHQFLGT